MIANAYLNWFITDDAFPFFIQYGSHEENLFIHTHADFVELVFILDGEATHIVNGTEYPIKKGDVFVINQNTSHGYNNPKNFHICNIMFHLPYFLNYQREIQTSAAFHALFFIEPMFASRAEFQAQLSLTTEQFALLHTLLKELYNEYCAKEFGYENMIISLMTQMFTMLTRFYSPATQKEKPLVTSIANAVSYIEKNFSKDLSLAMLAASAGISERHFRRLFQSIYHTSPLKYITALRIQSAMKLLTDTDLTVTEIALRCGFSDPNYFSNKFKIETGKSPLNYRDFSRRLQL